MSVAIKKNEIFYDRENNTISIYDGTSNISNLKLIGIVNVSSNTVILKKNEIGYDGESLRIGDGINQFKDLTTFNQINVVNTLDENSSSTDAISAAKAYELLVSINTLNSSRASKNSFGLVEIGNNINVDNGIISINDASTSSNGLMSSVDKSKLDGIDFGAQVNSITGVKGDNENIYRTGNVNITKTNIGLENVENTSDIQKNVNSALTLTNSRTINIQDNDGSNIGTGVSFDGSQNIVIILPETIKASLDGISTNATNDINNNAITSYIRSAVVNNGAITFTDGANNSSTYQVGTSTLSNYNVIIDSSNTGDQSLADGSIEHPFNTISGAINFVPDVANNITLKLKNGTYSESSEIIISKNINSLTIEPYSSSDIVNIACSSSDTRNSLLKLEGIRNIQINSINFDRGSILIAQNSSCIEINQSNFIINSCAFNNAYNAISTKLSNGKIIDSQFTNLYCCINASIASKVQLLNNLGDDSTQNINYVIICEGSIVYCDNDISLAGSDSYYLIQNDGKVLIKGNDIYSTIVSDQEISGSGYSVSTLDSYGKNSYRVTII